jgi:hypothetical protein
MLILRRKSIAYGIPSNGETSEELKAALAGYEFFD